MGHHAPVEDVLGLGDGEVAAELPEGERLVQAGEGLLCVVRVVVISRDSIKTDGRAGPDGKLSCRPSLNGYYPSINERLFTLISSFSAASVYVTPLAALLVGAAASLEEARREARLFGTVDVGGCVSINKSAHEYP